jgi:predicted Zn finger-like uncharacterized protein
MSLVTSCPQCRTGFRISHEQLAAGQGKVRCGKCQHVFDARSRLAEIPPPQPTMETSLPIPPSAPGPFSDTASREKLGVIPARFRVPHWLLVLLALALLLGALLQALYYLRSPIAAQWPALRPHLVALCERLHCAIALPQQAELLAIDDSDMQEDAERAGVIHLSVTIINNAPFAQAYPLLELTLTDAYDKPVIRRALSATEYLSGKDASQGIPAGKTVEINLALTAVDADVAGYRVFLRYPA